MEQITLSREAFYNLLWSKPIALVAAECNLSIPVIRQICLDHEIPWPWTGFKYGKDHNSPKPLPESEDPVVFDFYTAVNAAVKNLQFPGETTDTFRVPTKLLSPDDLIVRAQRTIDKDWQLHGLEHMMRTSLGELNIRTSKKNMDRALRIMDTLLKIWKARGYQVSSQDKETRVQVRAVGFRVSIREITKVLSSKNEFESRKHEATGQLAFRVDGWQDREWKDGKTALETNLKEINDHMEVAARDLEKIWAERKAAEQLHILEAQAEAERIRNDTEEHEAFQMLLKEAREWHDLNILDQYLDKLSNGRQKSPAFEKWLEWARHRRRLFDPAQKRRSEFGLQ